MKVGVKTSFARLAKVFQICSMDEGKEGKEAKLELC